MRSIRHRFSPSYRPSHCPCIDAVRYGSPRSSKSQSSGDILSSPLLVDFARFVVFLAFLPTFWCRGLFLGIPPFILDITTLVITARGAVSEDTSHRVAFLGASCSSVGISIGFALRPPEFSFATWSRLPPQWIYHMPLRSLRSRSFLSQAGPPRCGSCAEGPPKWAHVEVIR